MTAHHTDVIDVLDASGLLGGLPADMQAALVDEARRRVLAAGEWLFRQDDAAESLFVVESGCLDIVVEVPGPPRVVGSLARGSLLGELALITRRTRSAAVRARRDSVVLEVTRQQFDALVQRDPRFSMALLEVLGRKLSRTETLQELAPAPARVWCVIAAGDASQRLLPELRATMLQVAEPLARLQVLNDPHGGDAHRAEVVDRAEAANDVVLLAADDDDDWKQFARRQADRVVLLVDPVNDPPPVDAPRATDLVFAGVAEASVLAAWERACTPDARHLLDARVSDRNAVRRLTRRLLGRATGVVLSGGGARGLAHIGVLQGMAESGMELDRVGGTSMGSFVAAMHAMGMSPSAMQSLCRRELVERHPFRDVTVPRTALVKGRAARLMLSRVFGAVHIEQLPIDFFCVSADLVSAETVVHRTGLVAEATTASMAVPGWMPPVASGERLLVDGGLLDNLPISVMAGTREGPVVAVDVMGRFPAARDGRLPKLFDTLARSTTLGSWRWIAATRDQAQVVITPTLPGIGLTDFAGLDRAVALGREAALQAVGAPSAASAGDGTDR